MKHLIYLILIVLAACTSRQQKYEVILLAGQSNMVGVGKESELADTLLPSNVTFYDYGMAPNFKPMPQHFGPEMSIARMLGKSFPDQNFILIKHAIGGASLYDWAPKYDPKKAKITGHPQFGNMFDTLFTKLEIVTKDIAYEPVAFLWMQGERDARVPEAGVLYYNHLKDFIEAVRERTQKPNLPFLYGLINPPVDIYPALDTVRASQIKINDDIPNTHLIETEGLEKWEDRVHYSTNGQLELGNRFAERLAEILASE